MATQYQSALDGAVTPGMRAAADEARVTPEVIREQIAAGRAVIPANPGHRNLIPRVVGRDFPTRINANLGASPVNASLDNEHRKVALAVTLGADCVMDLSVGENLEGIRRALIASCPVSFGTVPVYEALSRVDGDVFALSPELLLAVIRDQADQGVDFMTLHSGLLRRHLPLVRSRRLGIVSRGGAALGRWMTRHKRENPLYEAWDEIMTVCRRHDITVSLGDGLRPGCLADAGDAAQYAELDVLGELVTRCRGAGVQVMVEGPGHVPLDQIPDQMRRQREVCNDAPFYVLGPLVTDIAPGYDHLSAAIGAAVAAQHGASLLCYVTPAEHLALPDLDDVRQGVVAFKLAAHAADIARGIPGARERDDAMAVARREFDWERQFELALDPETARGKRRLDGEADAGAADYCSMCGKDFCAVRNSLKMEADG